MMGWLMILVLTVVAAWAVTYFTGFSPFGWVMGQLQGFRKVGGKDSIVPMGDK